MIIDNFLAILYSATAAAVWSGHVSKSGQAYQLMKMSTFSDILAYFVAVPLPCSTKIKRPRALKCAALEPPSSRSIRREAIPRLLRNCPWPQGTNRKRTRTLSNRAVQVVEGDARTTATTVMHVFADTVMPTHSPVTYFCINNYVMNFCFISKSNVNLLALYPTQVVRVRRFH